jgi:hypothetical protein
MNHVIWSCINQKQLREEHSLSSRMISITEGILTTLQINIKNKEMIGVNNRIFFAYPLLFYGVPDIRFILRLLV